MWNCPSCKSTNLTVSVETCVKLIQGDDENFETDADGSDHVWDANSGMVCNDCNFAGKAGQFEDDFTARLKAMVNEARTRGYALTYWSPDELGESNADQLLDVVISRGNEYIASENPDQEPE